MRLTGLIAATHAPLDSAGCLRLDSVALQSQKLVGDGVRGAFVNGTTGEWASLSVEEREAVVEAWCALPERPKVIVHVGALAQVEAIRLASHAKAVGADGVAALAPSFFKPGPDAALDWLAPVAAAAAPLPFYYYHLPSLTGVDFPLGPFVAAARERIPNFAGVKNSKADLFEMQALIAQFGADLDFFYGYDEQFLASLAIGCTGWVGSNYNWLARPFLALKAAFSAGEIAEAQRLSRLLGAALATMSGYGAIAAQKAMMERLGVPVGPARPPLVNVAPEIADAVFARLTEQGLLP